MWAFITIFTLVYSLAYADLSSEQISSLRKRAESGDSQAQLNLGLAYANGDGVMKNNIEAVNWWTRSAERGNSMAQFNIGLSYAKGDGVSRDYLQAIRWYRRSIEQDDRESFLHAQSYYSSLNNRNKGTAEIFEYVLGLAIRGSAVAQNQLGYAYENGIYISRDEEKAVEWYLKSAEQGNAKAQCNIGFACLTGAGTKADKVAALAWWTKSAEQNNFLALLSLVVAYSAGWGTKKSEIESYAYFSLASDVNEDAGRMLAAFDVNVSSEIRTAGKKRADELRGKIKPNHAR